MLEIMTTCSKCGLELPPDAPEVSCPNCILSFAVGDEESVPDAKASGTPEFGVLPRAFGDYELLEEIARGGMGVVYKARQKSLNRIVAVKMILTGSLATRQFIHRFRAEAGAAAALQHPNIVAIHEVGVHEFQHFFAMDYVEGQNLAQLVGRQALPSRKAARYLQQIAIAIHYAHCQGILHRDLKPSNVMVDAATDQPRVTDFGLAKRLDGESSLTVTGQMLGSPSFMPPEQASPNRSKLGRPADVYALGAILYHLLTARSPFQGDSLPAIVTQVLNTEPISPRSLNPTVARDLETICLKCLEKDPGRRYATAEELAAELGRFLADVPILARPIGPAARLWRWCCRKPAIATLGAMVLVLVLVVLLGAPVAIFRIDRARLDAERSRVEANRARVETERNLYAAHMQLASESLRHGAIGQVQELLNRHYPSKGAEDLRGFEWRYLAKAVADQTGLVTHQFQGLEARATVGGTPGLLIAGDTLYATPDTSGNFEADPRPILAWDLKTWAPISMALPLETNSDLWWHPDNEAALALNAKDHTVTVYRLPHLEKGPIIPLPGKAIQAAVSKDFHTLGVAFEDGDLQRVLVWDLIANVQRRVFGKSRGDISKMEFSPDSTVLMVEWDRSEIALWSIPDDKALPSPPRDPVRDWDPSPFFAPHSTRLFTSRGTSKDLQMWDWSSGQLSTIYHAPLAGLWALGFSPNGSLMATGWGGEVIALTDTKDFKLIGELRGHAGHILSVVFSPSGRLVATASRDRTAKLWDPKTLNELATLIGNDQQLANVVFTPDEKSVVTLGVDGEIKVWDLPALLQSSVLLTTTNVDADMALSADKRFLATSDGAVHLWDLARASEIRSIPTGELVPFKVAFSPKDPLLAFLGQHSLGLLNYQSGQTNILAIDAARSWRCAAFSPDGRDLAFSGETNITFCEVATLKLRTFARCDRGLMNLAFSPDGTLLASGHPGGGLTVWNRINGSIVTNTVVFAHEDYGPYVDFSGDGRFLASAGGGPIGKIWEVMPSGLKLHRALRGDLAWFGPLRFLPDGRRAISMSDRGLKLWDTETGLEVGTLYGHRFVNQVAFSHDGNTMYSLGDDGHVRTWQAPPLERFPIPPELQK